MGVYSQPGEWEYCSGGTDQCPGGQNAFGSATGDASTFLLLKKVDIGDIPKAKQMTLFEAVELDFEKNLLYSITFGTSSVTITKIRIPVI